MNKETKNVADVVVDSADKVYSASVDRTIDRMEQVAENIEKDKETAKKAVDAAVETAGVFAEAVADHVSGLLNGEKLDYIPKAARNKAVYSRFDQSICVDEGV